MVQWLCWGVVDPEGAAMTTRDEIESVLRAAYAARVRGDLEGTLAAFHPDVQFRLNGRGTGLTAMSDAQRGHASLRPALAELIKTFRFDDWREIALLVDGERAALHWRARVTNTMSGKSDEFDVVDVCRFEDGKIVDFLQSFDSALVMKL
jgi:ketosteroid isomerase-like protein